MGSEGKAAAAVPAASASKPARPDCIKCFDELWFCYSPFYQVQVYYRYGQFDNCFGKWGTLIDCLSLKTKRTSKAEEILASREKEKTPHIWTYRTVEEASGNWHWMYRHISSDPLRDYLKPLVR